MVKKTAKPAGAKPIEADRAFKTAWFAKEARKATISDAELCRAISQVMQGQADDLGGGVYKKRLKTTCTVQLSWLKLGGIGYMFTYMQRRIERISRQMNWLDSKDLRKTTVVRVMQKSYHF